MSRIVRGVLFDLDNTLYDRDRTFVAWARWFVQDRLGIQDRAEARTTVDSLVALDARGYGPKDAMFRQIKSQHPNLVEDVEILVTAFREQHLAQLVVDEQTTQLLDALTQGGVPWGIVTNGSRGQLSKVRTLGLEGLTPCVVISEVAGCRKPDPEIFRLAAANLEIQPRDILFVGDNPEADIMGAARLEMQTAWLQRGREWPDHFASSPPNHTIHSLSELLWVAGAES